jgi:hypothetical protein
MNIDQRDIGKGLLPEILPEFYPNSISHLCELNEYRMYAEVWSNQRNVATKKRRVIGHEGYIETLEFGEKNKKRKSDRVRFDYFAVADSINYKVEKNIYGDLEVYIQMGGIQTNSIFNEIIKEKRHFSGSQFFHPNQTLYTDGFLPNMLKLDLEKLGLQQEVKSNKFYFEISTNSKEITNKNQKMILLNILGKDAISKKLPLLYKANRKYIRCLFDNPDFFEQNMDTSKIISRLCVAWPFNETIVFDFAGTAEDYNEVFLLGTLIKTRAHTEEMAWFKTTPIDSYV